MWLIPNWGSIPNFLPSSLSGMTFIVIKDPTVRVGSIFDKTQLWWSTNFGQLLRSFD